jgi:Uma2 family endonuclease
MSTATVITAEEFATMSFDRPVELVRGEIVAMTNPGGHHGKLCLRISGMIYNWLDAHPEYDAASNDTGVLLECDPDTVSGPDVLVIRKARLPGGQMPKRHLTVSPEVAIEIRSPSDRSREALQKAFTFLAAGVTEVWVVEPNHHRVTIHRDNEETTVFQGNDILTSPQLPDFECPLSKLFEGIT